MKVIKKILIKEVAIAKSVVAKKEVVAAQASEGTTWRERSPSYRIGRNYKDVEFTEGLTSAYLGGTLLRSANAIQDKVPAVLGHLLVSKKLKSGIFLYVPSSETTYIKLEQIAGLVGKPPYRLAAQSAQSSVSLAAQRVHEFTKSSELGSLGVPSSIAGTLALGEARPRVNASEVTTPRKRAVPQSPRAQAYPAVNAVNQLKDLRRCPPGLRSEHAGEVTREATSERSAAYGTLALSRASAKQVAVPLFLVTRSSSQTLALSEARSTRSEVTSSPALGFGEQVNSHAGANQRREQLKSTKFQERSSRKVKTYDYLASVAPSEWVNLVVGYYLRH